jgi:hypothetical protein
MRCIGCNKELTDFESTRRYADSEEFVDLCNDCFSHTGIKAVERADLMSIDDVLDLDEDPC